MFYGTNGHGHAAEDALQTLVADPSLQSVDRIVDLVRRHLDLDVAYVAKLSDGKQYLKAAAAASDTVIDLDDLSVVSEERSFCYKMVRGEIGHLVPDTSANPVTSQMDFAKTGAVGCYVGVPVFFSDGSVYGSLCAISQKPRANLKESDLNLMRLLARLVGDTLEREELERENRKLAIENVALDALIAALEARDGYTSEHSDVVVALAGAVAVEMGLDDGVVAEVKQVGLLHDIGKIGIPDAILHKPGPLTQEQWVVMKTHPEIGARIVGGIEDLRHLAPAVRAEHERWDGTGYPDRLAGEEVPLASRIVLACDAWHAMTSDRPYRTALSGDDALARLLGGAGTQFDPEVIEAVVRVLPAFSPERELIRL